MTISRNQQAKEWAEGDFDQSYIHAGPRAAAELILSLPDTIVDGDKLRETISKVLANTTPGTVEYQIAEDYAILIGELIPAPSLPTLEDMDEDARHALIGKDVKVEGWNNPSTLVAVYKDEGAVLGRDWTNPWPFVEVRPLSELTPVNGDDPTVAEQENVTPDQAVEKDISNNEEESLPRPEDAPPGQPWIVEYEGFQWTGVRKGGTNPGHFFPWLLTRMDGADDDCTTDNCVTLISRLVPKTR